MHRECCTAGQAPDATAASVLLRSLLQLLLGLLLLHKQMFIHQEHKLRQRQHQQQLSLTSFRVLLDLFQQEVIPRDVAVGEVKLDLQSTFKATEQVS